MNQIERAVLLIGSAKRAGESTSESLGSYLMARLSERGVATTTFAVQRALRTPERVAALLNAVDACDVFVLAFPLYVDTLPSLVTQALEAIAAQRREEPGERQPWFLAIANCGFPEARHNDVALAICEQFATATKMRWAGGLALGAGGAIHGGAIHEHGMTHNANSGAAWVELPAYFEALNRDFRYQLTPIGGPGPNLYIAQEVQGNRFLIAGGAPGLRVSWQVTGIRHDAYAQANPIVVEVDKPAEARGTLLHPEAFGVDSSYSLDAKLQSMPLDQSSKDVVGAATTAAPKPVTQPLPQATQP